MVDNDGVVRLGGLGSAFSLFLPVNRSDVDAERPFCRASPGPDNLQVSGLADVHTIKASDMFAFGMLAWEVSRFFAGTSTSRYSPAGTRSRSSNFPESPRL